MVLIDGAKHGFLEPLLEGHEIGVAAAEVAQLLAKKLSPGLGEGEIESLAMVVARGYRFCTADGLAVRTMKALAVLTRRVPLEELLSSLDPEVRVPDPKYSRAAAEPT